MDLLNEIILNVKCVKLIKNGFVDEVRQILLKNSL